MKRLWKPPLRKSISALLLLTGLFQIDFLTAQEANLPAVVEPKKFETVFDQSQQLQSFDQVWQTIKDVHWDPELVGERWDAVRAELRPRVEQATNADQVRQILRQMLGRLGQSHCGIIPAEAYLAMEEQARRGGVGISGLTVRFVEEQLVVTQVRADSPASEAGIECGWKLQSITQLKEANDESDNSAKKTITSAALIEQLRSTDKHRVARLETAIALAGSSILTGSVGERLRVEFLDHSELPRSVEIQLVKGFGTPTRLGHLPLTNVEFQSRRLPDDIGYIAFNAFLDPIRLINEFQKAINEDYKTSKGLVIDLRGNLGGLIVLAMGMSGWFVEEPSNLGQMTMKNTPLNVQINPRSPRFLPPVAVLIDECSISAAEIYAGGLLDLGAARVFGSRSAGLVLPSNVTQLPNEDGFQYVLADYSSASGRVLEGNGVEPDETIVLTRELLRNDPDPVLTAATRWIASRTNK